MDLRQKHSYQNQFTHIQIKPVCAKAPYPVFPLGSVKYSHKTPWSFPKGRAAPQGLWRCGLGDIVVSNNKNLCASQAWGFGAPPRVPLRGSCWHSHCNPGQLRGPHSGLNTVYRLSRWWFWSPLSFHPGSNPSWYLLPFCPKCSINCNISFRLKFPVGLFHSGHDSGKKKKSLFFVSHFGWAADGPTSARQELLVPSVNASWLHWFPQDIIHQFGQGLSGSSEITKPAQGWGR